ncbi:redoxin domain-containing protein [Dactylosporangium sp. NPDC049742]|uniref:redoxin domain-containing protein n=1 Tax=Dactylosporangium sp. NPDC049742 TaxID=3154737 RepID=UPI003429C425
MARHAWARLHATAAFAAVERGEPEAAVRSVRSARSAAARYGECPTCSALLNPVGAQAHVQAGAPEGAAELAAAAARFALGYMAKIKPEFDKRGVKLMALSVDPVDRHAQWAADIEETQGTAPNYPMIGDADFVVSKAYGMLGADVSGDAADRTAAQNQTVRGVFVIGPDKKIKLILLYPMTTGRNFDEILRVIDSLQLTARHAVATPVNWRQGEDVVIAGSVSNERAREVFGVWKEPKPYIRIVAQPA